MLKFKEFWTHNETLTEKNVNEWLAANPEIEIVSVNMGGNSLSWGYMILYRIKS